MENKSLAFDYIYSYLYENENVADDVPTEPNLSEKDRQELSALFDAMKQLIHKSRAYNELSGLYNQQAIELAMENSKNTMATIINIKNTLSDIINDAKVAYKYVLWMYLLAFVLGLGLIVVAIVFAAMGKTILAIAFGTIGLLDIVSHFIFKPPLELQSSRSNLTQLIIVVTNWFTDLVNLNSYINNRGGDLSLEEQIKISEKQNLTTEKMVKLIEKYSEPSNLKHNRTAPGAVKPVKPDPEAAG